MSDPRTAAELDADIRALAALRAGVAPSHPVVPPEDPALMFHADNMLWHVRPVSAQALEIALYHAGLGWTGVQMSRAQLEDLQDAIASALRQMPIRFNPATPGVPAV